MAFLTVGDGDGGGVLKTNVLTRMYANFGPGEGAVAVVFQVLNSVTGTAVTLYDADGAAVVAGDTSPAPINMTIHPVIPRIWFTPEFKITTAGEYVGVVDTVGIGPDFEQMFQVTAAGGLPSPTMNLCTISDHVIDPAGVAMENVGISARVLSVPKILSGAGVATQIVQAFTDSSGYFSFSLIQGITADVIIPEVGYRRSVLVPSTATANLFSIA
jgi:hypothetical protein